MKYENIENYVHLDCDLKKNAMGIVFLSPSVDNNGTAMAVQRMILNCGSKKYPVRDTIGKMEKKSLNEMRSGSELD